LVTEAFDIGTAGLLLRKVIVKSDGKLQPSANPVDCLHTGKPELYTGNKTDFSHRVNRLAVVSKDTGASIG
jgi:hypothetical protein